MNLDWLFLVTKWISTTMKNLGLLVKSTAVIFWTMKQIPVLAVQLKFELRQRTYAFNTLIHYTINDLRPEICLSFESPDTESLKSTEKKCNQLKKWISLNDWLILLLKFVHLLKYIALRTLKIHFNVLT